MESVLKKTVASLETALRYNPDNVALMTSLAEGYVRMGRLDATTISLCEKVLSKYPDNLLLQQAQAISYVIDQSDQLDESLAKGLPPPSAEALEVSIGMLDDFIRETGDNATVCMARTRLLLLSGRYDEALQGIEKLKALEYPDIASLRKLLDWLGRQPSMEATDWMSLFGIFQAVGEEKLGIKALERAFDKNASKKNVGPPLLSYYLSRFSVAHPEEVPEAIRPRFFQLLLDFGESSQTGEWLRKASLHGWQVTAHSKAYVKSLIEDEQLESAFEILQRMTLDDDIKTMLNEIASHYEKREDVDRAVHILQFINTNELTDHEVHRNQEIEMNCNMELSLAELQIKNGRLGEALNKYIAALCLFPMPDPAVVSKIDGLIEKGVEGDPKSMLRLASYFRKQNEFEKAIHYLNVLMDQNGSEGERPEGLETLFDEVLEDHPDSPSLRLHRGRINHRRGRFDEAITDFKIAATAPELADQANRYLAQAYRDAGHYREALSRYQGIRLAEDDLEGLYQLHLDFTRSEDTRSALTTLEMIRNVQPDYRDVGERLRQFEDRPSGGGRTSPSPAGAVGGGGEGEEKMRELIGDLAINRYQFIDKIGSGGMGVVYKVMDVRQGKAVAMKILRDGLASSSKALDRFFREARIAAQIRHRNIVDIYDYNISSQDGQNYIVMEYIEGQSLREFIDLHFDDTISTSIDYITEMLYYGVQLFDALQATHNKGIIHRDIKPDNIMIAPGGEVKITDFGIVHVEEATFTPTGAMLGTPRYMAPEQVTGQKVDGRSDIYSVGILLYEVLTGSPPFMTGDISYQQVNKQPVEPRLINSVIPQSVNNFILKCLEKRPENRFPTASEAKNVLAEILQSLGGCAKFENMTSSSSAPETKRVTPEVKDAKPLKPRQERVRNLPLEDNLEKLEMDDLDLD